MSSLEYVILSSTVQLCLFFNNAICFDLAIPYVKLGCFADHQLRALPDLYTTSTEMTNEMCMKICKAKVCMYVCM